MPVCGCSITHLPHPPPTPQDPRKVLGVHLPGLSVSLVHGRSGGRKRTPRGGEQTPGLHHCVPRGTRGRWAGRGVPWTRVLPASDLGRRSPESCVGSPCVPAFSGLNHRGAGDGRPQPVFTASFRGGWGPVQPRVVPVTPISPSAVCSRVAPGEFRREQRRPPRTRPFLSCRSDAAQGGVGSCPFLPECQRGRCHLWGAHVP